MNDSLWQGCVAPCERSIKLKHYHFALFTPEWYPVSVSVDNDA
jgi:hypothetical protein